MRRRGERRRISLVAPIYPSPVAADGKLYFTGEEGEVRVVKAGDKFELLAINPMGDVCMATPAIADGMIFIRTQQFLYGIGRKQVSQGN